MAADQLALGRARLEIASAITRTETQAEQSMQLGR